MNSYQLKIEADARRAGIVLAKDQISQGELVPNAFHGGGSVTSFDGDKFLGGFGGTKIYVPDYWTLRARSEQIFTSNLYARGIIDRLITNEINTGLMPDATPDADILGLGEDMLNDWSDTVEARFGLWGKNPRVCDFQGAKTWGALQRLIRTEALVGGDVLVTLVQSRVMRLPQVQIISGLKVQTPLGGASNVRKGHTITHGVETDAAGRVVAYWVLKDDGSSKRIPMFGERSGRRMAWMVYGTERRVGAVRGEPLVSLILQSLNEIDKYRDATQRKALMNSLIALQIIKTEDKPGTLPITGAATRKDQVSVADGDGGTRQLNLASYIPGLMVEEMQHGEEIKLMDGSGTDINFGTFEQSIIQAVAWSLELPPEVLMLSFGSNYSASQAAINEFKMTVNRRWGDFGETLCTPIYIEWLVSEVLLQKIEAPRLLESWRDLGEYDVFGAWTSVEWYGSIKLSTDMLKQVKASKLMVDACFSTNARETRLISGMKYSQVTKRVKRENELKVEAMRPLAEFKREFGDDIAEEAATAMADATNSIIQLVEDKGL